MSFNYGKEKRKFEAEWRKAAAWYAHAGMDKDSIEEIQRFDWELFCKERTYSNHTQALPNEIMDESDERSSLFQKYETLSVAFSENDFNGRYDWIQAIDNQELAGKLRQLSNEDLELLTLLVIYELTQREIAVLFGISQVGILKRIERVKKLFQ